MEEAEFKELLAKYELGTCSPEERVLVESWYLSESRTNAAPISAEDLAASRHRISKFITEKTSIETEYHNAVKKMVLWPRIAAAAAILLFTLGGVYLIGNKQDSNPKSTNVIALNDVRPGNNGAFLTLGNGTALSLNQSAKGQLSVQGGVAVTKTTNGQVQYTPTGEKTQIVFNTITTLRKQQYEVVLADGTRAWLNAASSIKYPSSFKDNDREVMITGEVYFEVAHNAAKPFKVISQGQTIEVLGTHFNVNTYEDEPELKTTLLEGSVKIFSAGKFKIIKPGQQALVKNNQISVNEVSTEEAVAWKNGYFRFNQEKIGSIMRKLSRWYDVDVEFDGPMPDDEFSGTLSKFTNISKVLEALSYYKTVHFKIEGRRIIVAK